MARKATAQFNIRSHFVRERVQQLANQTGMTATQIVEEALRAYVPPLPDPPPGLKRVGPILVLVGTGRTVTFEEAEAELHAVRERDL